MQHRITKSRVEQLQASDRDTFIWDTDVKGFGVRCRPSGSKYYVLKYRAGTRQRWLTIGRHGSPWTPDTARREARDLLTMNRKGKDPAAERDRKKDVSTIAELGDDSLTDYVATHCKPITAYEYRRSVERYINPKLGHHPVEELTRADVSHLHHSLRRVPYQANRVLAALSKMMNLAEEWGLRPDGTNPCRHVKKYDEEKRERFLTNEELDRLGRVLTDAEATATESPFVIGAIRLLIFTGARLSEIVTLQWKHVDLEKGVLRLPISKTGAKEIHLNAAAADVLCAMPRKQNNPYVIAGAKTGAHLVEMQKPWRRIRAKAKLDDVRIHDLRHNFASVAVGAGMSLPMIGKLLGHSQPATTARYAHLARDQARDASNEIGKRIMEAMQPKASGLTPKGKQRVRLEDD